jgi:hypothetical protein
MSETPENKPKSKQKLHPAMDAVKWKPGQSGNPGGRPKRKPVTELYEEMLSDPGLVADLRNAIAKAIRKGNMAMVLQVREMTDRVEGKVMQPIEADVNVSTLAERMLLAEQKLKE